MLAPYYNPRAITEMSKTRLDYLADAFRVAREHALDYFTVHRLTCECTRHGVEDHLCNCIPLYLRLGATA